MTPAGEPAGLQAAATVADAEPRPYVLAHLSDPHVPNRLATHPAALLNKRAFGYLSWHFRRSRIHRREVLDALSRDMAEMAPDHVAVTGDIVNIALPREFVRARDWLRTLGAPADVTVVPGNHDAYVAVSWERSWDAWRDFMRSDDGGAPVHASPPAGGDTFPVVRRRRMVIVIGLSTAIPTMPGHSSGKVGARQLERLEMQLRQADAAGLFRVVLLHHPPRAEHAPSHKQLSDAEAFRAVIAEAGAELILHGHEHRFRFAELAGPFGSVPVFGVPSASLLPRHAAGVAGEYHLHHIARHPQGWLLETHVRSYSRAHDRFREARRGTILLQRPWTQAAPHSTAPAGV